MRARAEWVSTSSTDGAYVIPADAGTSAIGEFRLWRSRIESGMTQGPIQPVVVGQIFGVVNEFRRLNPPKPPH